jgi:DNA-binding PadR family transcriptional regulator
LRLTGATLDVLEVLLKPDDELYGLKIAKASGRPTGSVFPILARLEQAGWVLSDWEATEPHSRGPRRRFYRLSADGLPAARAAVSGRGAARGAGGARSPLQLRPGMEGPA